MLTSVFAGIDFADELEDTNEMETGGRAAKELKLHDVLQPRETFVDAGGNTRNGIDIGDVVYFRPIIINDGDDAHDEFNIRVTVTPAGDNIPAVIDNLDDAVCYGNTSVTGCSFNTLAPGNFLGGGNYRVQAESGGDLAWTPTIPGEYLITVSIDVAGDMDTDLTNNDLTYSVVVQHYRDIVVDLCWTDGSDCSPGDGHGPVQGAGPHNFALFVTAEGSEAWQPRSTEMTVTFGGSYSTNQSSPSTLDTDGSGPNAPVAAGPGGHTYTFNVGEEALVDVWHNASNANQTVTDPNDLAENPCANGDNPCNETRNVLVYETTYVYHGSMVGNEADSASNPTFTITAMLNSFDSYEPKMGAAGGGGPMGEEQNPSTIMVETTLDYDDRSGNNDGQLAGSFTVMHDVGLTSLTGGINDATEGTVNVGMTRLTASVIYAGSSETNSYQWDVTFTVTDENNMDALNGMPGVATECLDEDPTVSYSHATLGNMMPAEPEGKACIEVDLQPGRYTVTASVNLIGTGSTPDTATDMNSGNNMRGTFFEVINDNPTVYMTLDDIVRGDESVEAPVIVGDWITMRARGMDTETPESELVYSWQRVTVDSEVLPIMECATSICSVPTDVSWIGERMVTATVTDTSMATATDSMLLSVWNSYSRDMSVTGATMSYSLVYGPVVAYNVSATDGISYTGEQLGNNAGAFDSLVSFDLDVSNLMMPQDMGTESMTIDFDGDAATNWGLWYKRTVDSPWQAVNHVTSAASSTGVTLTFNHDGSMEGNLGGGTYAIFDVASYSGEPPATGTSSLTASLAAGARVVYDWGYVDDSLLGSADVVSLYHCAGVGCDAMASDPITNTPANWDGHWEWNGADGESYTVVVQTENGNVDANTGEKLTGGASTITVVADGSVSPAPSICANPATSTCGATVVPADGALTFTWTATNTDDVASYIICWAGAQSVVENSFSSLVGNSCAETSDTTTSLVITEQDMCNADCTTDLFFAVGAKDQWGNVYSADTGIDHMASKGFTEGGEDPGVINNPDDGKGSGDDDGLPATAMYAIIGLVVLAVIGGAFILTRGADADGDEKEWDY